MHALLSLTLSQVLAALHRREFSVQELTHAYIARMASCKGLNAFITMTQEQALDQAEESDRRWAKGEARLLEGIPIGVKDAYCTKGIRTTAASKMLGDFVPSYESSVTQKLREAGTIMLGKTNLDEFCMGSATTPVYTSSTLNPWDPSCSAGGSSGGSASAVASGSVLASIGTDTGGSVRQPAAFCGIVGVKPTHGLCSRWGVVAFASSLDCPGPFARTVQDAAYMLQAMAGHDEKDATSLNHDVPDYQAFLRQDVRGKKIGIPKEWYEQAQLDPAIRALWERAQDLYRQEGCEIVHVSLPYSSYALACYYILASAEAASNLQRYDGVKYGYRTTTSTQTLEEMYARTRGEGFGPEVKRRILTGVYVLSHGYFDAYYGQAQKVRKMICQDFSDAFQHVDVLLTPTTPTPAFALACMPKDPVSMYWNDVLTVPVNIGNACAISVPSGMEKGLPIGLQLIAPALQEGRLFQFASVLERNVALPQLPIDRDFSPIVTCPSPAQGALS